MKKGFAVFLSFLLLFLGIPTQKAAALGDYTITLKVAPNAENEVTYLNGAVYDVFLKYKLDDSGNYIDPHGGGLVDSPLERGKVAPGFFDHAKKVGTVTINGADNPVVMEEDGTKNVRGSYIIRPVKRAPGYHLDRHPDGKYAEVEFPLIENGKEALVQTAEVTLKAERIQVKDSDLLKVEMPKPNPEVNEPLNGISFSLHRLAAPKMIGANNEVTDWELLPENVGSGGRSGRSLASRKPYYEDFLESVDGKLTIPTGKEPLKEGKYYLLIRNMGSHANKVTQINQGIYFTVSEDYGIAGHPEGKIVFESTSENDNSSYVKVIGDDATFGLRTKKKMDTSPITLMLPPLSLPKKAVILPNTTSVEKAFIGNEDTPYLYEISVDVPKDYPFYKSLEIKDGEVAVNKNIRPLFKKEEAAVSGEIKDLSSYTGEYDNISDPIFSKFQVFYENAAGERKDFSSEAMTRIKAGFNKDLPAENMHSLLLEGEDLRFVLKEISEVLEDDFIGNPDVLKDPRLGGKIILRYFAITTEGKGAGEPINPNNEDLFEATFEPVRYNEHRYDKVKESLFPGGTPLAEMLMGGGTVGIAQKFMRVTLKALKVDSVNPDETLTGAKFKVYKKDANTPLKTYLGDATEFAVSPDGKLTIEALPYFEEGYDLEEVAAPAGYRLPKARFHVNVRKAGSFHEERGSHTPGEKINQIDAGSHTDTKITNVKKANDITDTGTIGTLLFGLAGAGALGAGITLRRKKK